MDFVYTSHQVPRGARPDADVAGKFYLIKNVSQLRLTYQIKILAYMASTEGQKLIVQIPKSAKIDNSLRLFVREMAGLVRIERA
jgi:hypothetical protein